MTHDEAAARLDDYLDGTLDAAARAALEAHLPACPACRDELTALSSLLADARALPRSVMPGRELWPGIEARLGRAQRGTRALPFTRRHTIPLLAAAALLLLLGGAFLGRLLLPAARPASTFAAEQQRYTEATAVLARQLAHDHSRLPAETRAVVERNLAIVDAAISEAQQALTTDPGNTALEQMVLARYQQRLALLKRATDAGRQSS